MSRVRLLELIELRAMAWQTNENVTNYYKQKFAQIETDLAEPSSPVTAPVQLNLLSSSTSAPPTFVCPPHPQPRSS